MDLRDITPAAILIMVAIIALTFGAKVISDVAEDSGLAITNFVANETHENASAYWGGNYINLSFGNLVTSSMIVTNGTGYVLPAGNYTLTIGGRRTFATFNMSNYESDMNETGYLNMSYSYRSDDTTYATMQNTSKGLGNFSKWIPTLALVIMAAIIIGVISMVFYFGKRS